jgi:hypothetical protein
LLLDGANMIDLGNTLWALGRLAQVSGAQHQHCRGIALSSVELLAQYQIGLYHHPDQTTGRRPCSCDSACISVSACHSATVRMVRI